MRKRGNQPNQTRFEKISGRDRLGHHRPIDTFKKRVGKRKEKKKSNILHIWMRNKEINFIQVLVPQIEKNNLQICDKNFKQTPMHDKAFFINKPQNIQKYVAKEHCETKKS